MATTTWLRGLELESKALSAAVNSDGWLSGGSTDGGSGLKFGVDAHGVDPRLSASVGLR